MTAFIIRRLIFLPAVWLAVTLTIFAMLAPLGPYQRLPIYVNINPETLASKASPEQLKRIIDKYGLDDPFLVQYGRWLNLVAHGNLGWSKSAQAPVAQALRERFKATLELTLFSVAPSVLVAIWLGVIAAVHHNRWQDNFLRAFTISAYSLPVFVFGIFSLMLFYGALHWFPPGRLSLWAEQVVYAPGWHAYTGLHTFDALLNHRLDIFGDAIRHLVLPVISVSYLEWALLLRVTRTSMLETLGQDYVVAARAKGAPERQVVYRHALRNALIPVTTISGNLIVGLLGGVFITETVYNFKGIGFWAIEATSLIDVPAILGITLFLTALIVLGNLVVDIGYTLLDPRIRY